MKAYSLDLRERIVDAVDGGLGTQAEIAVLFSVNVSFVKKLLTQRRRTGSIAPKGHGGGMPAKLSGGDETVIREMVEARPDATLERLCRELAERSGVRISVTTMCRVLERMDLPRKKKRLEAPSG